MLRELISRISSEYPTGLIGIKSDHPYSVLLSDRAPEVINSLGIIEDSCYLIQGSAGNGKLACVPWVAIFDLNVTLSAQRGQYIVYLRAGNGDVFLTFNQGCSSFEKQYKPLNQALLKISESAKIIQNNIEHRGFSIDGIDLLFPSQKMAKEYQAGTILSKRYRADNIPSEEELRSDLSEMITVYKNYVEVFPPKKSSWLLTYNPEEFPYEDYEQHRIETLNGNPPTVQWLCKSKQPLLGDRVYLLRLGNVETNGIIASGYVTRVSYQAPHYNPQAHPGNVSHIEFVYDIMLEQNSDDYLKQSDLRAAFPEQDWSPQGSGIEVKEFYKDRLERAWKLLDIEGSAENVPNQIQVIENIKHYIENEGFSYPSHMIENFYLSLKSKPFVILAGTSGTGKTKLVSLFAEAIGAADNYKLIPVRPDWSDSSDLFGHVDLNGRFKAGALLNVVKKANSDLGNPYIVCLDEMNLARVEYYLSDFLSIIETRKLEANRLVTQPLVEKEAFRDDVEAFEEYGKLYWPENLYLVGTVNMDETTFPFSKKVLDRANTIEFNYVNLKPNITRREYTPTVLTNDFLKTRYISLGQCSDTALVEKISTELGNINSKLEKANCHIGYRIRDEIVYYLMNNKVDGSLLSYEEAMDFEIMQKILPRIQGSSTVIKTMLCELFKLFVVGFDYKPLDNDVYEKMNSLFNTGFVKYPNSARKIAFMVRRYEEDGFTSYWL
ncbi:dynein-related subfamily AAA family protein [Ruminococcaceae bacterium R-25]|nr:dynein-related subfamily AAA family protein [Ruminococcaceae bacterium R-25]SUQ11005.1 AAA domain (dynein-related subfamily) [Oscillospiraceae bacterium]